MKKAQFFSFCLVVSLFAPVIMGGFSRSESQAANPCDLTPPLAQTKIESFLKNKCYAGWGTPSDSRLSGAKINGTDYAVHQFISTIFSPEVKAWLDGGRVGEIPDGGIVIAFEKNASGKTQKILTKVKLKNGSADGWFWSETSLVDQTSSKGEFGFSNCIACHASADKTQLTFLSPNGPIDPGNWTPDKGLKWPNPPAVTRKLPTPLSAADPGFLSFFKIPDVPLANVKPFPAKSFDHVVSSLHAGPNGDQQETFFTSDQCVGCHNASQLLSNSKPNMWDTDPENSKDPIFRNYSPYGEWSASINGLAGRDPVWHAQVETERLMRPQLANFTDNTCFSCHGAMAGRQLQIDKNDPGALFTIDMFYKESGENAKYGALARDGVSCTVCHRIDAAGLGVDPDFKMDGGHLQHLNPSQLETYTALFNTNVKPLLTGPYKDEEVKSGAMDRALKVSTTKGSQLGKARLCGSCHTVIVPAIPLGYTGDNPFEDESVHMAFEQTTYLEWRNSMFQNEPELPPPPNSYPLACQSCHMRPHKKSRIANIESDRFPPVQARVRDANIHMVEQKPYPRHTLMALNLFLLNMFEQFPEILGSRREDTAVPKQTLDSMLTAQDWMEDHAKHASAKIDVLSLSEASGNLEAKLRIASFAGHKFPTGAGFRRAFIEFQVFDGNDKLLWASGRTSSYGVILKGTGTDPLPSELTRKPWESQPHYQIISKQDQVQIYETRALDSHCQLQTTVLGIFHEYKDNRLLPAGWKPDGPNFKATEPRLPDPSATKPIPGFGTASCQRPTAVVTDPDYDEADHTVHGGDNIIYRIPLDEIPNWARVEAKLQYQTIPPYFLRDRFESGRTTNGTSFDKDGPLARDTRRLAHIASRLNVKGTAIENWTLQINSTAMMSKGESSRQGLTLNTILNDVIKTEYPVSK